MTSGINVVFSPLGGDPELSTISTILNGNGIGSLDFGNCNTGGSVGLYLNNKQISSAAPSTREKALFQFHDQDVLKMVQYGTAIMQYNDFNIINCAGKLV